MKTDTSDRLDAFLNEEYKNIAEAHFSTVNSISQFFRYYLVVVSLPVSAFAVISRLGDSSALLSTPAAKNVMSSVFTLIAFVGFCVLGYMANLRFDALLYARVVNGIRDQFLFEAAGQRQPKPSVRVLPRSRAVPRYYEVGYFMFVVVALALIDAGYLFGGWYPQLDGLDWLTFWRLCAISGAFFIFHILLYWGLSAYRESSYLAPAAIGIDLDGVLNNQTEHFCATLKLVSGKDLRPDQVREIPVRRCPGMTAADEASVFNRREYWESLQPQKGAAEALSALRAGGHSLTIYTSRPWPLPDKTNGAMIRRDWLGRFVSCAPAPLARLGFRMTMRRLTKEWLKTHDIPHDKVVIDGHRRRASRHSDAKRGRCQFFVEDDLSNAIRLNRECEAVLLMDQPYNRKPRRGLPSGILRVTSWEMILDEIESRS